MNTRQQDLILLAEKHGEITIKALAQQLGVSEMTIHRDLEYLQEAGMVYKKRGAAVFVGRSEQRNLRFYAEEKCAIGRKAASMLEPGQSVIFDNSTTALECARALDGEKHLTCYTTNLEIAQLIAASKAHILYCSGGYYFPDSGGFIGPQAEQFAASIRADVAVIGASGISLKHGITNPYPMHNSLQQKIMASASRRILLADHSKFDRVAMEKTADLDAVDVIITDSGVPASVLETYQKHVNIIIADKE